MEGAEFASVAAAIWVLFGSLAATAFIHGLRS